MDSLYLHILASASDNIETALEIFAVLLFLHHQDLQITPRFIESFLSLREGEVFMVLSDLHSIIAVPSVNEQDVSFRFFHASLGDFLTDHSRSGDTFFLDSGVCHRNIVNGILRQLMNPASGSHFHCPYSTYWVLSMIALVYLEMQSLRAAFPEQCLKATPDPKFLSNLYDFDTISICPHQPRIAITFPITHLFTEIFDAINSSSRVPELLVWMQGQVCWTIVIFFTLLQKHPYREDDLFTHHLPSINVWLKRSICGRDHHNSQLAEQFIASATLVDFPEFPNIHHLIPRVLDLGPKWHTTKCDSHQIEDSGKWEIHVKYRHILSRFLTDRARSGGLFVDQSNYISLEKYLALFLRENLE